MKPVVSIIMANFNGAQHLGAAVQSVLGQSLPALELVIIDDGSTDGSVELLTALARADRRIKLCQQERAGPAAARNRGLNGAVGDWIAIVDSDDVIHADRLRRLVLEADAWGADIVADNQILFNHNMSQPLGPLLTGARAQRRTWITAADYVRSNTLGQCGPSLGLLKPLIRRSRLLEHQLSYNESLSIAEDYDLVLRALQAGLSFAISPFVGYYYRKHPASISHRLSFATLEAMKQNAPQHLAGATTAQERRLHEKRAQSIANTQHFLNLVDALKRQRWIKAVGLLARHPTIALLLAQALNDRFRDLAPKSAPSELLAQDLEIARRSVQSAHQGARSCP